MLSKCNSGNYIESQLTIVRNSQRFSVLQMMNKVKASPPISDQPNEELVPRLYEVVCTGWAGALMLFSIYLEPAMLFMISATMATCVARYYVILNSLIVIKNLRRIKRIKSSN